MRNVCGSSAALVLTRWPRPQRSTRGKTVVAAMSAERTVIITGANTGIGQETAKSLASKQRCFFLECNAMFYSIICSLEDSSRNSASV